MLAQHIINMQGNIFCEQQRIVTRRVKQAIPEGDARKYEFLEMLYTHDNRQRNSYTLLQPERCRTSNGPINGARRRTGSWCAGAAAYRT